MSPTNGSLFYGGDSPLQNGNYGFNVRATYTCDSGFVLVGGNRRTCTGESSSITGAFDGEAPTCERKRIFNLYPQFLACILFPWFNFSEFC